MKDHYNFAKNLAYILKSIDMSQSELAKKTGLTRQFICQLLKGVRYPSLHTTVKILQVIPVGFERLIKYK